MIPVLLVSSLLAACRGARGPGPWVEGEGHRAREVFPRGDGGFRIVPPEASGIVAANALPEAAALANRTLADGAGVAIGDVDGDGLPDIYLARVAEPNVLYRNLGDWRFEDITGRAGVALDARPTTGAALADIDGDGDLDLLVTALGAPNALLRNEGDGRFTDVSGEAGFTVSRASRSMALADVDADGDLDLYVVNNKTRVVSDLFPPEERSTERVVVRGGGRCEVAPDMVDHWRVECLDVGIRRFEIAEEDEFYLNDGAGRFTLVPFTDGRFADAAGRPLTEPPLDWGLSVRFHDIDGDGSPDLYVCNDFESPDHIWLNDGSGRFREAGPEVIRTTSLACMAVDFADVDRDGDEDLFTADMEPLGWERRKRNIPPLPSDTTPPGGLEIRVQRARNTLQLARGDGTYADVAPMAGVAASEWSWGSLFLDVDLDGFEDLLVATGHVWDLLDADTQIRVGQARGGVDWREEQRLFPPMPMRNFVFRNRGDGTFEERGEAWGFGTDPDIAHGLAGGDLDLDGDIDLIVTRLRDVPLLLENRARAPRVMVRLSGRPPNTQGIGAIIRVLGGAVAEQRRTVAGAGGYLSSSDPAYAFATGGSRSVEVEVRWPGGAVSRVTGVLPDRVVEIREPAAGREDGGPRAVDGGSGGAEDAQPRRLFEEVPLAHAHVEPFFDELGRQPLLPERLAQGGPGVSWIDVDQDGDPDLLVGAGRGGRLAWLRNDAGTLAAPVPVGSPTPYDQTTILGVPRPSGVTLLVGRMTYEAPSPEAAMRTAAVVALSGFTPGGGAAERAVLSGSVESVGPLALADVDADGDLDLFVGGRAMPARYPRAVGSRLLRNEGDHWRADEGFGTLLAEVGVVSAASFTDLDADGDPDLALATDWGPVRVFRNDGGRFRDATRQYGLDEVTGRWIGLASGDLDGDGRLDLIATSWGLNTGWEASPARPLLLYHGDLDGNGSWEMIRARSDAETGAVVPLEDLRVLGPALPLLRRTVSSFSDYATATIDRLLGPAVADLAPLAATTLAHTAFLNRGDRFEPVVLPREAQLAPAFYAGVADADGDGAEDVFLTQNFFATVPGQGRYDAGRSLWLRGDGRGGLLPVPGQESGVAVYGDPRGAALSDFDADGRVDLAVSQNGAATRLFRNAGGRPGLRVRLRGGSGNPDAVGAALRVLYADGAGPVREVQAGSGYWSVNDPVQVLGLRAEPRALWVRWPGGAESETPVPPGTLELSVTMPGSEGAP